MSDLEKNSNNASFGAGASNIGTSQQTGSTSDGRVVRLMDFARPSKFNKDQLRTLHMLHDQYCRRASTYLSGAVRSLAELSVSGAEQVSYGDYVATLPVPSFTAVLEIAPLGTNAMITIDLPLVFSLLDRLLGGPGTTGLRIRELTDIEIQLASNMVERLLVELSETWGELVDVEFRLRGIEMNAQFAQISSATEPSVLIAMDTTIVGAAGAMTLCIPYRSIESVVGDLTAHRYFSSGDEEDGSGKDQLTQTLRTVGMPVRAVVGERRVPIGAVLDLKPGDVVSLGRRVEDGVNLVIGDTRAYRALPGRDGDHVAVRVVGDAHGRPLQ